MSNRYPGGFITLDEPTVNSSSAKGVWTLDQQADYQGQGVWPTSTYQISRSLRFNSADSAYLSRTPASAGNRKTWTWSGWVKRAKLDAQTNGQVLFACNPASGASTSTNFIFEFDDGGGTSGADNCLGVHTYDFDVFTTPALFRDVSAWYHIVLVVDTTQATSDDRLKLYVNNVRQTLTQGTNWPSQNFDFGINTTEPHAIGRHAQTTNYFLDGYLTEINFIDGQALTPSDFGETDETTGVWSPIEYTGTYGTNGFYLDFSDNSGTTSTTLGADSSGNGNNWTPNNFSVAAGVGNDSLVDSPTRYGTDTGAGGEVRGNYCTFNTVDSYPSNLFDGNLRYTDTSGNAEYAAGSMAFDIETQNFYWEAEVATLNYNAVRIGIISASINTNSTGVNLNDYSYYGNGNKVNNGVSTAYGASFNASEVVGIKCGNGQIEFFKSGVSQGVAFSGLSGLFKPCVSGAGNSDVYLNFGQRPFAYTAPSGFKALCTTNLPEPTVVQGDDHFTTTLYTGNDGVNTVTTGLDVATDGALMWFKNRSVAVGHALINPVAGYDKYLSSDSTGAENSFSFITSTSSTGFTMNTGSSAFNGGVSAGGPFSYALWSWKANGAGSSNTDGTITSTVSANQTAGISIVTWTNPASGTPTIGHGLGVAPAFIIVKDRTFAYNWDVGCDAIGWANRINLNTTSAAYSPAFWNSTAPTSTVFTYTASGANSGDSMVAYCFAEVEGFSKFGSYTGNGSADGPFVYTGFRPAFVIAKRSDNINSWNIVDSKRSPYNLINTNLTANTSNAEGTNDFFDFTSNGFKVRTANTYINDSGGTWIYIAFAENPFKNALAR